MSSPASAVIADAHWRTVEVTPATRWSFVEIVDQAGTIGVGEATLAGHERAMSRALIANRARLLGRRPADVDAPGLREAARLPEYAAVSAIDQALWDLRARQARVSVAEALGGRRRDRVPVYANVNRATIDRTPEGFATQARRAAAEGFRAVKIAPFDGIDLRGDATASVDATLLDRALARVAAVREAVGDDVALMVDCHWRLNRPVADAVIDAVAGYRLHWLECPVPESTEFLGVLRALRARANAHGMRLAGCETVSGVEGFRPFLDAGAYDVMMPDVKYVGGLMEVLDVAATLHRHGVLFSPHNPSGPVAHAASLQICAASDHVERLEMQYRETPHFDALVGGALPSPVDGVIDVPAGLGFGVRLDPRLASALDVYTEARAVGRRPKRSPTPIP